MSRRQKRRKELLSEGREQKLHKTIRLRHLRIAPRKVRAVADTVRGLEVDKALAILDFTFRSAATPLAKLLRAAVANIAAAGKVDIDALIVKEIQIDQGPSWKRFMPRAMGRATPIKKRTCHVVCQLAEKA